MSMRKWKVEKVNTPKEGDDHDRCQAFDTLGNQCELEPHKGLHQARWVLKYWKHNYKPK